MKIEKRRIGIMGGTFDPIHCGHLLMAEFVGEALGLERVAFVPNGEPPHHKPHAVSERAHRLRMTELAVAGNPRFCVSTVETSRPGPSYSIDTIRELNRGLPVGQKVHFIVGADELVALSGWHEPDAVLDESNVVGVARAAADLSALAEALGRDRASRIRLVETPLFGISSSEIRSRVARRLSIRYMTPDAVICYIRAHGLYAGA